MVRQLSSGGPDLLARRYERHSGRVPNIVPDRRRVGGCAGWMAGPDMAERWAWAQRSSSACRAAGGWLAANSGRSEGLGRPARSRGQRFVDDAGIRKTGSHREPWAGVGVGPRAPEA